MIAIHTTKINLTRIIIPLVNDSWDKFSSTHPKMLSQPWDGQKKKRENRRSSCFLGVLNRSFIQNVVLVLQVGEFHFDMRCEEIMEQMVV